MYPSLTAVSYTHLDVYKRQAAGFAIEVKEFLVQIRIGALQAPCHSHIFSDLCRPGCHNLVHNLTSSALFYELSNLLYE